MLGLVFRRRCCICGNTIWGLNLFEVLRKQKKCQDLGEPRFEFEVGDQVKHRDFVWKIINRKYWRRGKRHSKEYNIEVVGVLTPMVWIGGRGPVGTRKWANEKRLSKA